MDPNLVLAGGQREREVAARVAEGQARGRAERADERAFDGRALVVLDGAGDARLAYVGMLRDLDRTALGALRRVGRSNAGEASKARERRRPGR